MSDSSSASSAKPYIAATQTVKELTVKAVLLGIFFGILFGVSSVYLALKIGLTVSASIPVAVLSVAIIGKLGRSTILENNIVQTMGSAGESIAGGVAFTIPALIFLGYQMEYPLTLTLAMIGGTMGVLFMIPLRRYLIVKEHGKLPYPEGTACADVLVAGEKGGKMAGLLFSGLGFSVFYKFLMNILGFWKDTPSFTLKWLRGAVVSGEITPELLGVGYIIGPKNSGTLAAGGALAWLVMMPMIKFFGDTVLLSIPPAAKTISQMSMMEIWANYIRYIGGGAVVFGGLVTLIKTIPTFWHSFAKALSDLKQSKKGQQRESLRTDRDLPLWLTVLGALLFILIISFLPFLPGEPLSHLLAGLLVVFFGLFFCTVSSRITGIVGSSSSPISAITIITLMLTCLVFVLFGLKGKEYAAVALSVGAIICVAAANAGNTSQDLKTGYLVGATPFKQQLALLLGVLISSFAVGFTLILLQKASLASGAGIGSAELSAPKAQLMAIIIEGVLSRSLPWDLILLGFFTGLAVTLCGVEPLIFAIGVYLPFSVSLPIFIGGLVHLLVKKMGEKEGASEEMSPGVLYSSGLIAGGAIMGIVYACLKGFGGNLFWKLNIGPTWNLGEAQGIWGDWIAMAMFAFMAVTLFQMARKRNAT